MPLVFVGIDPNTGDKNSPTVWVDTDAQELVLQGWKPGPGLEAQCAATTVPGHAHGIPDSEAVVRIPARMIDKVKEACDVLGHAGVR
ncbi:hypothetical protein O7599_14285 [Streptomyces sp. WMMC500]|uniref:hypothetical protein n=1 Tax=Streptomyces sp. WMMC500 TaxID=3015154 RepID=UPI00248B4343|nr:hypothetical protein [Streptomyces sp. WMMC500]WBB63615.1 hypothetical protein O7599_14285 [Streptomyces sp. WMMC500]